MNKSPNSSDIEDHLEEPKKKKKIKRTSTYKMWVRKNFSQYRDPLIDDTSFNLNSSIRIKKS